MSEMKLKLALDLGTTTLAGRLLGPGGSIVAEAQCRNPQSEFGFDVIRRLEAALDGHAGRLQLLLAQGISELVRKLLSQANATPSAIDAAAAAGNPAVTYLLRRLPPEEILFPPHRPRERSGALIPPGDLGLEFSVPLYIFPLVSGYVGGDLVAFVFAGGPAKAGTLFLDIGTNGEMALRTGQGWWTTSVAAGPAFEGAGISCGMPAEAGAVEDVFLEGDSLRLKTIGGATPCGLCGSGVASAVAAARQGGLIDHYGTLAEPGSVETNLARYLVETAGGRALRLYRDASVEILLTQEDIRSFQLAKGAVRAGVECLLHRAGANDPVRLLVTGAFGLHLPQDVLKTVAIIPQTMVESVCFIPDGALAGVCRSLTEDGGAAAIESLALQLRPYPLSGTPAFEKAFLEGMNF
jgi:uncharacterized 2Fe-2S/4Fe-4S cluster protein (DUF4445 family)